MLTKDIRKTIDNARDVLVGKIPNPQAQIEQITIAMIYKFMDDMDIETVELGGNREFFIEELSEYAWSKVMSPQLGNEARMNLYTEALDKLQLSNRIPKLFRDIFKGAYLPFRDGQTLTLFLKEINDLSYSNSENLGNGFEYLLSIMGSQGDAGQFRTPRHIIDFIVSVVEPTKDDRILDPACGTAGFLISAYKYILNQNLDDNGKSNLTFDEKNIVLKNINGYDIAPSMVKISEMNLFLHGASEPKIYEYDTLTSDDKWGDKYECILANPPFMTPKGGIIPHNKFSIKSSKSEILFVDYIANHLTSQGKAGIIVPDGVVFKTEKGFVSVRKDLIENSLWAVISLPSGIFQPYAGVSTNILLLDKKISKLKNEILFIELNNDGYSLTTQRKPIDGNEIPEIQKIVLDFKNNRDINSKKAFIVSKDEIINNNYDLNINKYKVLEDEVIEYEPPQVILENIKNLNNELNDLVSRLGEIIGE